MNACAWARRRRRDDLLAAGLRPRIGDVGVHRRAEQERVVARDRDGAPQRCDVDPAQVGAVDEHATGARVVEPGDQRGERRLARAGGADERDRAPARDVEIDVVERVASGPGVAHRDALEAHVAAAWR